MRRSVVEALVSCQNINGHVINEAKSYLYKAIKNIDIAIGKQNLKIETSQERKQENRVFAKQAQATTVIAKTLQELNKMIEEKEKELLELEAKRLNKNTPQRDDLITE